MGYVHSADTLPCLQALKLKRWSALQIQDPKNGTLPIGTIVVSLGLPYRILNINHKKELLRSLWVLIRIGAGSFPRG